MTTKISSAESATAPRGSALSALLNLPTAEQVRRNLTNIFREQIIGAATAGDDERLDYWLARYVELRKVEARPGPATERWAAS